MSFPDSSGESLSAVYCTIPRELDGRSLWFAVPLSRRSGQRQGADGGLATACTLWRGYIPRSRQVRCVWSAWKHVILLRASDNPVVVLDLVVRLGAFL